MLGGFPASVAVICSLKVLESPVLLITDEVSSAFGLNSLALVVSDENESGSGKSIGSEG